MTMNVPLATGDPAIAPFFTATQEMLSGAAVNFRLQVLASNLVGIDASAGDGQVAISVGGYYRFRSTSTDCTISGSAGTYGVFVTASANDFSGVPPNIDLTNYDFNIVCSIANPTGVDLWRKVGELVWTGTAITPGSLKNLIGPAPFAHGAAHMLGGADPLSPASIGATTMADVTALLLGQYRDVVDQGGARIGSAAAGTYLLGQDTIGLVNTAFAFNPIDIDPADYAVAGKSTEFRIKASLFTNAVAPGSGVNFTVGLYPITGRGGASGAAPFVSSVGSIVTGSGYTFNGPVSASDWRRSVPSDFSIAAADAFVLAVTLSNAMAANSAFAVAARLQVRNV
jgi:hypothetical protein